MAKFHINPVYFQYLGAATVLAMRLANDLSDNEPAEKQVVDIYRDLKDSFFPVVLANNPRLADELPALAEKIDALLDEFLKLRTSS